MGGFDFLENLFKILSHFGAQNGLIYVGTDIPGGPK